MTRLEIPHDYRRITCLHCGHDVDILIYCGHRFCPKCSIVRGSRIRRRLSYILDTVKPGPGQRLKMLTLSCSNVQNPADGIKHLVKSFRRMRQRAHWKHHVSGGAIVLEITGKKGSYHPHLHIILYSTYFPWQLIRSMWRSCSGGNAVWINDVSKDRAKSYVTKYITKTSQLDDDIDDVEEALKGCRLFQRFGIWHDLKLPSLKTDYECPRCQNHDWLSEWDLREIRSVASRGS